ncbi:MAG: cellulase family glycosylhydrolase, partial [Paludibacteraceae bacterium]|nr:cellulase family glycosylhydrolase [Paludibacteraceae bacterium]
MKNLFKMGILPIFLAILPLLTQAQIKIEAEDYTEAQSLKTEIILENNKTSVGYFDEVGEKLTYQISIPESGLYQFSFKYLAGKAGSLKIEDSEGASFIFETEANLTSGNWWELPMNNWPEFPLEESALFYFEKGMQTIYVINMGTGLNIDFFSLKKSSSTDDIVTKIRTNPSKIEIMPNETAFIIANGLNASREIIAKPIRWSDNVVNGEYKAGATLGSDIITIKIGDVEKEVKVSICNPEKKQEFVVSKHGQLNVKGGSICDAAGNKVSLMGPSFYWSCSAALWWTKETVDYLVSEYNVQIIRLPVSIAPSEGSPWNGDATWNEDNYYHRPEYSKKLVDEVVKAAIENDIYVIIEFHEHHAEHWVDLSKDFFTYFATKWGKYPNVMYEIYNEPMTDNSTVVNYAKQIIPVIRNIDSKNIIIVGSTQ